MKLREGWDRINKVRDITDSEYYPLYWETQEGVSMTFESMQTTHLFYALRMIYNHYVPEPYRIRPYTKYNLTCISAEQWRKAAQCMAKELSLRSDLPGKLQQQLNYIIATVQRLLTKQLNG